MLVVRVNEYIDPNSDQLKLKRRKFQKEHEDIYKNVDRYLI